MSKNEVSKEANVCTLTPEQAPAVKGLRLGMSYDEVAQKFRAKCNLTDNTVDNAFHADSNYSDSFIKNVLTLRRYYMSIQNSETSVYERLKPDLKDSDAGCAGSMLFFKPSQFPEFENVRDSTLYFDEKKLLSTIDITYTNKNGNLKELIDSLGLSKWTNWEIKEPNSDFGNLYCNNLHIYATVAYLSDRDTTDLSISALTNDEVLRSKNKSYRGEGPKQNTAKSSDGTTGSRENEITRRRYAECVRQREAFGADTSPCSEWASER